MKKIAFLSLLILLAFTTSVKISPALTPLPAPALIDALPDGSAVAIINFQKIAGSGLWATINAQDRIKSEIDKAQSEMANLGITLRDVHTIALVFSGATTKTPTVALSGGFDQNELLGRLRANEKIKLTSEKYKGLDIYNVKSIATSSGAKPAHASTLAEAKDDTSFVFYDASTLVAGSVESVRASVDVKTGAKPGLSQNSQLSNALAQNPSAAIRFAFSLSSPVTSGLKSAQLPVDFSSIQLIFGSIDVGSGIDVDATLRSDNAEHAKSLSEKLNALLTMASGFVGSMTDPKLAGIAEALKTVNIVTADVDVKITGNLPMSLLSNLIPSSDKK